MINRSATSNAFEFVVMAVQRTQQLVRGSVPRVPVENHKKTTIAQMEIVAGKIVRLPAEIKKVSTEPVVLPELVAAD